MEGGKNPARLLTFAAILCPKVQEARPHRAAGELPGGDSQQSQQHEPRGHALRAAR